MQTILRLALLSSFTFALPAAAMAEGETGTNLQMIRPSSRPMFATFSVAPALDISNAVSQVKLAQAFGYHFSGDGTGLAVGGELQESFGSSLFVLQVGPKAWYDFAIVEDLGIYLSPCAMLGLAHVSNTYGSDTAFNMQFGFEAKMVLNDRAVVFFRPFSLDIAMFSQTSVRYDLVFGAGATF